MMWELTLAWACLAVVVGLAVFAVTSGGLAVHSNLYRMRTPKPAPMPGPPALDLTPAERKLLSSPILVVLWLL